MTPYDARRLVMSRTLPPTQKFVLLILAEYADEAWSCYPGQSRIAANTGFSERTVRNALAELEAAGLIARKPRFNTSGRTSDRTYLIRHVIEALPEAVPAPAAASDEVPAPPSEVPAAHDTPTGRSFRVTTSEHLEEHPEDSSPARAAASKAIKPEDIPQGSRLRKVDGEWVVVR